MVEGEQTLAEWVDQLYAENDKRAFEIMHRIAELAVELSFSENDL